MVPHRKTSTWVLFLVLTVFVVRSQAAPPSCQSPSQESTSYITNYIEGERASFEVNRGNGSGMLVILRAGSSVSAAPIDGEKYNDDSRFGRGHHFGAGNYAVKSSGGTNLYIGDLTGNTTYYGHIYEYNKAGSNYCYSAGYLAFSFTTSCTSPSNRSSGGNTVELSSSQISLTWSVGDGSSRIVVLRPNSSSTVQPQSENQYIPSSIYGTGSAIGEGFVCYTGTGNSCSISGLSPRTIYQVDIFERNGLLGNYCYGNSAYNFSIETDCGNSSAQVSNPGTDGFNATGGGIYWTRGNGDRVLVIAKKGSAVDAQPNEFESYQADNDFGRGSQLGTGNYVVYDGTGTSVYVRQLMEGSSYHFSVYEYEQGVSKNCYGPEVTFSTATRCDHPSTKSSLGTLLDIHPYHARIAWTPGNGTHQLVVVRPASSSPTSPIQQQNYQASSTYGQGSALGSGFVVSDGSSGSEVNILGLDHTTAYAVDIYDYNQSPPFYCYNYSGAYSFSFTTLEPRLFTWNKSTGAHDFNNPENWSPNRINPKSTDSLIISNTQCTWTQLANDSASYMYFSNCSLIVDNSAAEQYLYISAGGYMKLENNATIALEGSQANIISLANNATLEISGSLEINGSGAHCIISQDSASVRFLNGSKCIISNLYSQAPFGIHPSNNAAVLFEPGSSYENYSNGGVNTFGLQAPQCVVQFLPGSRYIHKGLSTIDCSGRSYGTFVYDYDGEAQFQSGNQALTIDTLRVLQGSFNFRANQRFTVSGSMELLGGDSLIFDPLIETDIEFTGALGNLANSGGGIRLGKKARLVLKAGNTVSLNGNIQVQGGILNENNANLNIGSGDSLRIGGLLENQGDIYLGDDASLIQEEDSELDNTGTIYITRNIPDGASSGVYYFWSSPVNGGTGGRIGAGGVLSGSVMYKYNMGGNDGSDYVWVGSGEEMTAGRGYAVAGTNSATFYGTPNNGTININIRKEAGDSYNIVGNPYPSAINAQSFMDENATVLEGTIYLWSFNTNDNSGEKQYISVNEMGSNSTTDPEQNLSTTNIASCQGFFVQTKNSLAIGDAPLVFKNRMRNGYNNAFKSGGPKDYHFYEKNWLYVKNEQKDTAAVLYAMVEEATDKFDANMDAETFSSYFRIGIETEYAEQSILAVPQVDKNSYYPLTLNISKAGIHEIGLLTEIYNQESEFQPILLDTKTSQSIELDSDKYEVYLESGLCTGRFFLMFARAQSPGGGPTTSIIRHNREAELQIIRNDESGITVSSSEIINRIDVLGMDGKLLQNQNFASTEAHLPWAQGFKGNFLLRVRLRSGQVLIRKIHI